MNGVSDGENKIFPNKLLKNFMVISSFVDFYFTENRDFLPHGGYTYQKREGKIERIEENAEG